MDGLSLGRMRKRRMFDANALLRPLAQAQKGP